MTEYHRNPDCIFVETDTSDSENQRPMPINIKIDAISPKSSCSGSSENKGDKQLNKLKNYINKNEKLMIE